MVNIGMIILGISPMDDFHIMSYLSFVMTTIILHLSCPTKLPSHIGRDSVDSLILFLQIMHLRSAKFEGSAR